MKQFRYNTALLKSGFTQHHFRNMRRMREENSAGFTLVETLVAIAVLLVAIIGPMSIAAQGLQASFFSREQTTAVYLAQEAIEAVEEERNEQALEEIYEGLSPRIWQLCQNQVLPADPEDPIYDEYPQQDICEGNTWGWYDELTADDGPDCDASTSDSIGCDYDSVSGDFHVCTSDADCTLQIDPDHSSGRYYQYAGGAPSGFTRIITLSDAGDDEVLVTVEVKWRATLFGGTDSRVVLQTRLLDQYE